MTHVPEVPYDARESWLRYRRLVAEAFGVAVRRSPRERWQPWDGHRVHVDTWSPDGNPLGFVVLVHGGGGHGRLLAPLADPLAAMGYAVMAPDLPGYGITVPRPGWRTEYAAWPRLVAHLAAEAGANGPVALFGLSMGGMTAVWAAQMAPVVRAVVATTLIDLRDPAVFDRAARSPLLGRAARVAHRVMPGISDRLALPLRRTVPLERLTTAPALRRYFRDDPLLGARRVPARFFRTARQYVPERDDLVLPCPLLLVHPGADDWTPTAMSRPVYDRIPTPKEFSELSNGSHLPLEAPAYGELQARVRAFLARTMG